MLCEVQSVLEFLLTLYANAYLKYLLRNCEINQDTYLKGVQQRKLASLRKPSVPMPKALRKVAARGRRLIAGVATGRLKPTFPESEPWRAENRAAKGGKEPAASGGPWVNWAAWARLSPSTREDVETNRNPHCPGRNQAECRVCLLSP